MKGWHRVFAMADLSNCPLTHAVFQDLIELPELPATVEQLSYDGQVIFNGTYLPRLTHLTLRGVREFCQEAIHDLLDVQPVQGTPVPVTDYTGISKLQHFALQNAVLAANETDGSIATLLACSPRILTKELQSLDLTGIPVTDSDLEVLAKETPNLHTINLSRTTVTGAGVKDVVDNIPTLHTLILDNCPRISSRDIVQYAEKAAIKVSMKMNELTVKSAGQGGRRVRYG
jgi:F-box/TPR repeat protein Pof3